MEGGASAVQRNKQTRQDSYQKAMGSLDSANNLVAASLGRPRRQDSYQQAMGSMDSGKAIYISLDDKTLILAIYSYHSALMRNQTKVWMIGTGPSWGGRG